MTEHLKNVNPPLTATCFSLKAGFARLNASFGCAIAFCDSCIDLERIRLFNRIYLISQWHGSLRITEVEVKSELLFFSISDCKTNKSISRPTY